WGRRWDSRDAYHAALVEYTRLFRGDAIVGRTDAVAFDQKLPRGAGYVTLRFAIDEQAGAWYFYPITWRLHWGEGVQPGPRDDAYAKVAASMRRVQAAVHPTLFAVLDPDRMLSPACVICGKALTDPASQARLIGPECFGSSSLTVPWVRRLVEA